MEHTEQELEEYFSGLAACYARLAVLVDLAGETANELGETEISKALAPVMRQVTIRLGELTREVESRTE